MIQGDGVVGVVYQPRRTSEHCAVVLGGSGGGIPERFAQRVARMGITAFGVAYFGERGLPQALVDVPLESVQRAIEIFRQRYAAMRPVGLVGSSKGAELALCLASRVGELVGPVIAASPSSVSWYGLQASGRPSLHRPSWTWQGSPIPFLPFLPALPSYTRAAERRIDSYYQPSRYPPELVDAARVPVEHTVGPVLLLAGDEDHMWPSALMAAQIVERFEAHGRRADTESVIYQGAGHTFLHHDPARRSSTTSSRWDFGGDDAANAQACAEGWERIGDFLRTG